VDGNIFGINVNLATSPHHCLQSCWHGTFDFVVRLFTPLYHLTSISQDTPLIVLFLSDVSGVLFNFLSIPSPQICQNSIIEVSINYTAVLVAALCQDIIYTIASRQSTKTSGRNNLSISQSAAVTISVCFLSSSKANWRIVWQQPCLRRLMTLVVGVVLDRNGSVTDHRVVCR